MDFAIRLVNAMLIKKFWGASYYMLALAGPNGKLLTDFLCGCFIYKNAAVRPNVCLFVCLFFHYLFCTEGPSNN